MTAEELIKELQKVPPGTDVFRMMTFEYGCIEVEKVRYEPEKQRVIID